MLKMNKSMRFVGNALVQLGFWLSVLPTNAPAQTINSAPQGDNAIWQNSTTISGSQAFIDASAWCNGNCQGLDFCVMVNNALGSLPPQGGVVDARGQKVCKRCQFFAIAAVPTQTSQSKKMRPEAHGVPCTSNG